MSPVKFENVFVLCSGRCGSMTFAKACGHIRNYTSAHESRFGMSGPGRLAYPKQHIEIDNRISWMLGSLDRQYGRDAFYVHLTREPLHVAESFLAKWDRGIMRAWRGEISPSNSAPNLSAAMQMIETVTDNIKLFLRDKPFQASIQIERAKDQFPNFCHAIGADVNLSKAIDEFTLRYNAKPTDLSAPRQI